MGLDWGRRYIRDAEDVVCELRKGNLERKSEGLVLAVEVCSKTQGKEEQYTDTAKARIISPRGQRPMQITN